MNKLHVLLAVLLCLLFTQSQIEASHFTEPRALNIGETPQVRDAGQSKQAEVQRYRSGRRAYRPSPGYQAPVRAVPPRTNNPARTGGFFGGIGGFMAGAFLGSMLFGSFLGGWGHFSFLGLLLDLLIISVLFMVIRRLWTRRQERH